MDCGGGVAATHFENFFFGAAKPRRKNYFLTTVNLSFPEISLNNSAFSKLSF